MEVFFSVESEVFSETLYHDNSIHSSQNYLMLPHSLWGLDHLFHARIKLHISDVMQLRDYQGYTGVWCIMNHPIVNVCIMGDIQEIDRKDNFIVYYVDDGTDCIGCKWSRELKEPKVKLGDLVRVVGKVSEFNGRKDIIITFIYTESDPNHEILHWLEIMNLKKTLYSKPYHLSQSVINHQCKALENDLKAYLNEFEETATVTYDELKEKVHVYAQNTDAKVTDEMVESVLNNLKSQGYLVPHTNNYHILPDKLFLPAVLLIFSKYKESSLSLCNVYYELIGSHNYHDHITLQRTLQIIEQLIDENYIYPINEDKYQLVH